jgi:hypothetical protein
MIMMLMLMALSMAIDLISKAALVYVVVYAGRKAWKASK